MEKKDKFEVIKKISVILISLALLIYVASVIVRANFTQIKTETTNIRTVSDSIPAKGYFIRDEKLIENKDSGFISYNVNDGDRVSLHEPVATLFKNEDEATDKQIIDDLESQISNLQQLNASAETIAAVPDQIDKNIASLLSQINVNSADRDLSQAAKNTETLLYDINERQIITGQIENFEEKIKELQNRVSSIKKSSSVSAGKQIQSTSAGFFSSKTDGYENFYTTADLEKLMPGAFSDDKVQKKPVSENVIGKTMEGVYWYVACEVTAEEALLIKDAGDLGIDVPTVNNSIISVELHSINQKTKTSEAVVVLKGDYMNSEMLNARIEDMSIVLNTYRGIYIPKTAVHEREIQVTTTDEKGHEKEETITVKGAYIQIANELKFKLITDIHTGDDYVISKISPGEDELPTKQFGIIKPGDEVVVEGANLYDKKIVD